MGFFRVLEASNPKDYDKWLNLWNSWAAREVFAHPDYIKLYARDCDLVKCAISETSDGVVLLPFLLRPLGIEKWGERASAYYDASAPYGFGGPYSTGGIELRRFWDGLNQWAKSSGVVSFFFRLSPYAADITPFVDKVERSGGNVIRSLSEGKDAIWNDYHKSLRQCIRRAERYGLAVEFDDKGERLNDFVDMYYGTMTRRGALPQYYFPRKYFEDIISKLPGQYIFSFASYRCKIISAKIGLVSADYVYNFLGGTNSDFFEMNPNEYLTHAVFNWCIDQGKKYCVLGGGYKGDDGIFRHKRKFSPNGVYDFMIGKHVFDPEAYQILREIRKKFEEDAGREWRPSEVFFPDYRARND